MKNLFFGMALTVAALNTTAQTEQWCATDEYNQNIHNANPGMEEAMHEHLLRVTSGAFPIDDRDGDCIIPVVVHILHNNGSGNITIDQVESGLDMLNEDFNRTNEDAELTRDSEGAPFLDVATSMGIRFELAKIDPDGNCTNGIERRFVGGASFDANNSAKHYSTNGLDAWNRNYYFNIWIVNSISSGGDGTTLGYAEFPYAGGSSNYGVIIRNDAYGTTGTASGDRTLSHEVGHCLGLLHTFQGGCHAGNCDSQGDYCCDTPPVIDPQWSCSIAQNTCDEVPFGDPYDFDALDQFENFMSYSPCQNMFSADQKNLVLSNLESIAFLSNLVDPDQWPETGVGTPAPLCKAEFFSGESTICAGSTIEFSDASFSNVTSWAWTFEGGTPATSDLENPVVTYATPGIYSVSLEVSDGTSTEDVTKENYAVILSNPGMSLPFVESFETISVPDNNRFMVINEDGGETWQINEDAAYIGNHSVYINNYGQTGESIDELISGSIDLSGVDPDDDMIFNFKYSYIKRFESNGEWLRFYISKDCGETWALRKNIHGDDLSEINETSPFTPVTKDDWTEVNITNINPDYYSADFRFKFQFQNDSGNNIYLDDINMYPSSMSSTIENAGFTFDLYPNPASNLITLNYVALTDIRFEILNLLGQPVTESLFVPQGSKQSNIDIEQLVNGIYVINAISTDGTISTLRFVKK